MKIKTVTTDLELHRFALRPSKHCFGLALNWDIYGDYVKYYDFSLTLPFSQLHIDFIRKEEQ